MRILILLLLSLAAVAQHPPGGGPAKMVGPRGDTLPTTCAPGQLWLRTGSTEPGLYNCDPDGSWVLPLKAGSPTKTGALVLLPGTVANMQALPRSGSLALILDSAVSNHLSAVDSTGAKTDLQAAVAGGVGANYSEAFTSQTSVVVNGIGTPNVGLACYDGSDNAIQGAWSVSGTAPNDVTVTFATAQTGRCVVLGGTSRYAAAISGNTSYTITGATHGLGSCDVHVQVWDNSSPAKRVEAGDITCDSTSKNIVVAFATTQAGRLVIQ